MFDLVDGLDPHDEIGHDHHHHHHHDHHHDHSELSMNPLKNSIKCRNPKSKTDKWIDWYHYHSLKDCQSKHCHGDGHCVFKSKQSKSIGKTNFGKITL